MKHFSVDTFFMSSVLLVHTHCSELSLVEQVVSLMSFEILKIWFVIYDTLMALAV
jgi:hypothetical protein